MKTPSRSGEGEVANRLPSEAARWGLLATTLILGATLIGTTWSSHRGTVLASEQLARSEGEALLWSIRRDLNPPRGLPSDEQLKDILENHREAGLRYVAMVDPRSSSVLASAGEPTTPMTQPLPGPAPGGHGWSEAGDGYLLVAPAGGPRRNPRRGRPGADRRRPFEDRSDDSRGDSRNERRRPRRSDDRRGDPPPRGERPRHEEPPEPWIALEFEAATARDLVNRTAGTLAIGTASAAFLTVAALLFWAQVRARERALLQLEQQQRLSDLGKMSAVLAHEIRNPLASLKGNAQLLAERTDDGHSESRKVRRIVSEATRLEKLTTDLLDFVRSGHLERRPTDPVALAEDIRHETDADRVRVQGDGAPATWSLDPSRLRQVLGNLVRNALQASPTESTVDITIDRDSSSRGRELRFIVRDRGSGLPEGHEHEIFEPFFTTRTRGTGLGLAVARRLVELHDGTLTGRNHPTGGAEFYVRIPES